MKRILILITLILGFISISFASYTPTQKETQTLELIKQKLESVVKNNSSKTNEFKDEISGLKLKYTNNERATYILDYLLNILGGENNEKDNVGVDKKINIAVFQIDEIGYYFVNSSGNVYRFNRIESYFKNGYAFVGKIKSYINGTNESYVIDENLKTVGDPFNGITVHTFNENYFLVEKADETSGNGNIYCYYFDKNFKEVAGPYLKASEFSSGYATVINKNEENYYMIDNNFKNIIGPYKYIGKFSENYLSIEKEDGSRYYLDKNFNKVSGPYHKASDFSDGMAIVQKEDNEYALLDTNLKEISVSYASLNNFSDGYALVSEADSSFEDGYAWYFIDKTGNKKIGPYKTDSVKWDYTDPYDKSGMKYSIFKNGYALIREYNNSDNRYDLYFIDKTGNKIVGPFLRALYSSGYYDLYKKNYKISIVDKNLKQIGGNYNWSGTLPTYNGLNIGYGPTDFGFYIFDSSGYAPIKTPDGLYFLSTEGKEHGPYLGMKNFNNGIGAIKKDDGKRYFINTDFEEVTGPFKDLTRFDNGIGAINKDDGKRYFINTDFKEIAGPFEDIRNFNNGIGAIKKDDGKRYFVNTDFKEIAGPFAEYKP